MARLVVNRCTAQRRATQARTSRRTYRLIRWPLASGSTISSFIGCSELALARDHETAPRADAQCGVGHPLARADAPHPNSFEQRVDLRQEQIPHHVYLVDTVHLAGRLVFDEQAILDGDEILGVAKLRARDACDVDVLVLQFLGPGLRLLREH